LATTLFVSNQPLPQSCPHPWHGLDPRPARMVGVGVRRWTEFILMAVGVWVLALSILSSPIIVRPAHNGPYVRPPPRRALGVRLTSRT